MNPQGINYRFFVVGKNSNDSLVPSTILSAKHLVRKLSVSGYKGKFLVMCCI